MTQICIHQAADTIGGNCIEVVASGGERILLDVGRPLNAPDGVQTQIPISLKTDTRICGILLSHAHTDHHGLLESLPSDWPVYCGEATEGLLHLSAAVSEKHILQTCAHWTHHKPFSIGPFSIIPHLIDHSAFDAYALQIIVDGKTILYSGDFRAHGRKANFTRALIKNPPAHVDVLLLEGTNLRAPGVAAKATQDEATLENDFARLFAESTGRVFVSWSATNIDRVVTLFRACKKSGRTLIVDLYSMHVLMCLKKFANIPQPEWPGQHIRAVVTAKMIRLMNRIGKSELVDQLKEYRAAIKAAKLKANPEKWVIMARSSLVSDYLTKGVVPTEDDTWVWSMWNGYLENDSTRLMHDFFAPCRKAYIHSSGHATPEVLHEFAEAMQPNMLIPVHGEAWQDHKENFPNVRIAGNGEWITI